MMKKILFTLALLVTTVSASAQFEKGKVYVAGSLSGLNLSYNGSDKGSFGFQAKGGLLMDDNLMVLAAAELDKRNSVPAAYSVGVYGRYYIIQNGLYLGVGVKGMRTYDKRKDFMPGVQVGYAFFLNGSVTVEPEIYYDQSFKNHSDYSTIGFRIGVGVYL